MKPYHALLPLVAAMTLFAGCESRSDAQFLLSQAEAAVDKARSEAAVTTPNELKTVEGTLAHMKQNFDQHEYKAVKADVPQFNEQYKVLASAMEAKQAENAATIQEWATLNNEVPKTVEAVQLRVDSLKPNALPKEVTKQELETAKKDLETAKATWEEATKAADAGNPAEARDKGRIVQAKLEELKSTLAMSEQLASTAPATTPSAQ